MHTRTINPTANWLGGVQALSDRKRRKRRITHTHRRMRNFGAKKHGRAGEA